MPFEACRKKIIVKPGFQLKIALKLTIYILIYSLVMGFVIFYPLYHDLSSAVSLEEQTKASSMILYLHKRIWPGLLTLAVLAGIQTLFSSHRVAGPMYRFEKMANELIRGNYAARVRIRKTDEFKEMARLLNYLAEGLEISRTGDGQFYTDVKTRLETISAMLEAEGAEYPDDVKRLIQALVNELVYRTKTH
jgi:nitrate/nitrite-specific signal transduction histidine kinase